MRRIILIGMEMYVRRGTEYGEGVGIYQKGKVIGLYKKYVSMVFPTKSGVKYRESFGYNELFYESEVKGNNGKILYM